VEQNGHHRQIEHDGLPAAVDSVLKEPVAIPAHLLARLQAAAPQGAPPQRRLLLVAGIGACAAGYGGLTVLGAIVLGRAVATGALSTAIAQTMPQLSVLNSLALTGGAVLSWGALGLAAAYGTQLVHRQ